MTAKETKSAIAAAALLLGRPTVPTERPVLASANRTAAVRSALAEFTSVASADQLPDRVRFGLKATVGLLFNWSVPEGGQSKVTKATVKVVAAGLDSHYRQMVEMLAFASAWSPLLDADRLLNLVRTAGDVSTAYAPERYLASFTGALNRMLVDGVKVSPERREALAKSLWLTVHDGRYWDVTGGRPAVEQARRRRDEQAAEERRAINAYVQDLLAGADRSTDAAHMAVASALADMSLPFTAQTSALVEELPCETHLADLVARVGGMSRRGEWVNPDTLVLCSHIGWLAPQDLPESPASWLVSAAVSAWTDPESGAVVREGWPEKPKAWEDVYPAEPVGDRFPLPNAVYRLHGDVLPGTFARLTLIRSPQELDENRQYMGNCTGSYRSSMEAGTYALFRFTDEHGVDYNAAMTLDTRTGRWGFREINSRFNRGNVPPQIRTAFEALIAAAPPVNVGGAA